MVKTIAYAAAGFLVGGLITLVGIKSLVQNKPVAEFHEHADFALFINGQKMDFAKDKYMSTKPCTISLIDGFVDAAQAHAEDGGVADDVHLHDLDGGVIHVHREGVTFADFFSSLHMSFSDTSFSDDVGHVYDNSDKNVWRFFVNGVEVTTLANRVIRDLDQVLITYGSRTRSQESIAVEQGQISNRACVSSHLCNHRGPVAEESCGASAAKESALLQWLGV